ncbi:hypothetical protein ACQKGC_02780 [Allorhizobium pseudoryzae]|uniref:hypothetical protein n=1 Tax=Allorhizobium pseudoryzae TaxID=379684 RepID=UPI003D0842AA
MSRIITVTAASIIAALSLAGTSYAAMLPADRALAADHNPRILVMNTDEIEKHDTFQDTLNALSPASPEVRGVQEAIRENPALKHELLAQHVELNNVIFADEAADGSFVLYIR